MYTFLLYRYDFQFIIRAIGAFPEKIKSVKVLPYNGENFRTLSFNSFEFLDSLSFLQAPLVNLASDLKDTNHSYDILKQTYLVLNENKKFDQEKLSMILEKSFFPYEFCTSLEQMKKITKLPKRKHFYSVLSETSITRENHKFAKKVWKKFKCTNLVDYTKIYCKIDVCLLAEIFEKFRDDMIKFSNLDPVYYISLPAYSYDSMLKLTGCKIGLPNDIDMVHFAEISKRGGVSFIGTRHLKPNENEEILYLDANVRFLFLFHISYFYLFIKILLLQAGLEPATLDL